MIDNIIIGDLVDNLTLNDIGILPHEQNIHITLDQANDVNMFLPKILIAAGLYNTTSEIKKIAAVRIKQHKIKDVDSRQLWRSITKPEMTEFKIGKKYFWLVVGSIDK